MTRNRLIVLALLVAVAGGAAAYAKYFRHGPQRVRALPQSGGERPYDKVVEGPGHDEHLNGTEPVACRDCHEIRAEEFLKPDEERCQNCHEREDATLHASEASRRPDVCTGCHRFLKKRGEEAEPWGCRRCHGEPQGELAAVVVHGREQCGNCHRPHGRPATLAKNCVECHEHDKQARARHGSRTGAALCLDCHEPHGESEVAATKCVTCHVSPPAGAATTTAAGTPPGPGPTPVAAVVTADGGVATPASPTSPVAPRVPATAIFRGGHTKCTDCHTNHDFRAAGAKSCKSCHGGQRVIAEDRVRQHGVCTSCHDNHNPRASAAASCGRCHSAVRPSHPQTEGGRCTSCHVVHPTGGGPVAKACSSCHQQAGSETGFHAGGTRCQQCHRPHQFTGLSGAVCRNCHAIEANLTASNQGHQNCTRCHQAHRPSQPVAACGTCHAAENRTAPRGHRECLRCHDQHSGTQRSACVGCHQDRTQRLHGDLPGGCPTCHRAHGPGGRAAPPPCTSCHNRAALPNLHQVNEHAQCRACHGGHSGPRANRATCIACHEDKQEHEPLATQCSGCHTFGATQ